MLEFDSETARLLEIVYSGADATRRRQASYDVLAPGPGESILDIGCGNGFLLAELARGVGPTGRVIGVDPSEEMRRSAETRCAEFDWVDLRAGYGDALPVDSDSLDKAVSVQVFEYVPDLAAAARDVLRCLKPGGRFVIGDMHFDSLCWHSADPARMARMTAAWDRHLVHRDLPAILIPVLRDAGFVVENVTPMTICDHQLKPDGLARMMLHLLPRYTVGNGLIPKDEAAAWSAEQLQLAAEGRFFFAASHFVIAARKP